MIIYIFLLIKTANLKNPSVDAGFIEFNTHVKCKLVFVIFLILPKISIYSKTFLKNYVFLFLEQKLFFPACYKKIELLEQKACKKFQSPLTKASHACLSKPYGM